MAANLSIDEFLPHSELIVPEHTVARAAVPAIDAHNHLPGGELVARGMNPADLVRAMDELNLQAIVNPSGGFGAELRANLATLDQAYPGRFATFCNVDWAGVGGPGWLEGALAQLFKELGLRIRDVDGALVMPDDPRLFALWERAGELGVPVLIHTADPAAFFRPLDSHNERWDELHAHPDWHFYGPEFPAFEPLLGSLYRLISAHPSTTFITAHVGCYPENLGYVAAMMARYPNFYTDFSARIAELGRAPYSARAWMVEYADRILFGTDIAPDPAMYRLHFRFLETADEYFEYSPEGGVPPQGRWRIYGLNLPAEVLAQVYHHNAARLLGLP
jgi:predicted TIM-barrel fold metal-dependent hydrolase